ncbi:MAG TPA: ATP-binding protein [Thermoanaerobaculia bacterium]|nr:ATP-binding protein [Thermoanaerobaculia bacterium]
MLAAFLAAFGGLSVARKVEGFQPLGFAAEAAGGSFRVTSAGGPPTGLQAGDRIVLVDGRELPGLVELASALRQQPTSELLVLRDDLPQEVTYARPPVDVDLPYLILALIGAAYLLIGLYTVLKERRGNSRLFFLWCAASAAFYLFTPGPSLDAAGRALYVGDMLARLLLPPLTLHLFLVFPEPLDRRARVHRLAPFLYLPATFLLLVQGDLILNGGRLFTGDPRRVLPLLDRIELAHLALFALAAVAVLVRRLAERRRWESYRQVLWITIGLAGGYLPFLAFYMVPLALGIQWPEPAVAAAVLPLALVPLTFAYAILRWKLWDIDVIVRDAAAYTLTLLLGAIGFSLANLGIDRALPEGLPLVRTALVFLAGLGLAGVLVPAKRSISTGLERLQYRATYPKRRALMAFGRELLHERDLDRLCTELLGAIEDAVDLERANLYLVQGDELVPVRPERGLPDRLPVDAFGAGTWSQDVRSLSGVALPGPEPRPEDRLFAGGYRYLLPLAVRGRRIGLALTGYRVDQQRLSSDDVQLIRRLLDQAALAIENAQLLDELKHRLDEVVALQSYNEGIIESSPAGIAVVDDAGRIASANLGFAALAGRERQEILGRPLADVLPVEMPVEGCGPLEAAFEDALGHERHLQVSCARFERRGEERLGGGRILVFHDVTERVHMERALIEQDRLAALGYMAAGVAHEVNTPLTGISSYAQMLLAETPEDDPRHEMLRKVERQTFRASKIVNNLLEFARNRSGEMVAVDLAEVVDECLELLRERLVKRGVRVRWQRPEGAALAACTVTGEPGELQQVVTNLVLNAHDALEQGGELTVELVRGAADGHDDGRVRLTVADDGPGVAPQVAGRIFEPFVTTRLGRGGTGLGLAISHEIVRHHGGDLTVDSIPGEGARFTLALPARDRGGEAGPRGEAGALQSPAT